MSVLIISNITVSKSTFLNNKLLDKSNIAFICILGMITGFLVNHVASSISMFLFCVNALRDINPKRWVQHKWWLLGLAWMAILGLSYFWSNDKGFWEQNFQVKFPVLIFPLACGFMPAFTTSQLQRLTFLTGVLFLCGISYSLSFLIRDYDKYLLEYKWSVLLPTPCYQDHVRFSMALALFFIWCIFFWPWLQLNSMKWFISVTIAVIFIYLHILAAKSGLLAIYIFVAGWGFYISFVKKKLAGILVIISIPLILIAATKLIPTFSERKDYIGYAWDMLRTGDRSGKYGDVNRLMSYKLALEIIENHPLAGVGGGDMMAAMKKGYQKYYPQVEDKARLMPHNQFLITALGCGIPAMLLFAAWVIYPLTDLKGKRTSQEKTPSGRQKFFIFMVWLLLLTQLMIEPVLDVQNGVFVYLFFLWWQRQEMPEIKTTLLVK